MARSRYVVKVFYANGTRQDAECRSEGEAVHVASELRGTSSIVKVTIWSVADQSYVTGWVF